MAAPRQPPDYGGNPAEDPAIPFPFEPYPVQAQLMRKLYDTLERGGVGIFESPTGTGKSLSIICSALQWLKDREAKDLAEDVHAANAHYPAASSAAALPPVVAPKPSPAVPAWLSNYGQDKEKRDREIRAAARKARREELDQRLTDVRTKSAEWAGSKGSRRRNVARQPSRGKGQRQRDAAKQRPLAAARCRDDPEDAFAVDDYSSGGEDGADSSNKARRGRGGGGGGNGGDSSSEEDAAEESARASRLEREEATALSELGIRQVLYCSRTHSQTAQFVGEVKKTAFAAGVRCISLGSRRTLCLNPEVRSQGQGLAGHSSDARLTDACLDLQRRKAPSKPLAVSAAVVATAADTDGATVKRRRGGSSTSSGGGGSSKEAAAVAAAACGCPYLAGESQQEFRDHSLAFVRDIEELGDLGDRLQACPYYGTRKAAPWAQLVVMPYAVLLQRQSRESMGVDLRGAAVIIDEAHNIVEAVNSTHSVRLGLLTVERARAQLGQYQARYAARLNGKNLFYVNCLLRVLLAMTRLLRSGEEEERGTGGAAAPSHGSGGGGGNVGNGGGGSGSGLSKAPEDREGEEPQVAASEMLRINDFLFRVGMDNVNIFKVQRYITRSGICQKIMGFLDLVESSTAAAIGIGNSASGGTSSVGNGAAALVPRGTTAAARAASAAEGADASSHDGGGGDAGAEFVSRHISALQTVQSFLSALTNADQDGHVVICYGSGTGGGSGGLDSNEEPYFKFVMLNPAVHFADVLREARAVILVGGTMQPVKPLVRQLFPDVAPSRIEVFSCGHVVPPENLLPLCLARGPSGVRFDFTFRSRATPEMVTELGRLLNNVCTVVPGGVVVFLSSFAYMEEVLRQWKASGQLRQIAAKKAVFCEPRAARDVDKVLTDYAANAAATVYGSGRDAAAANACLGGGGNGGQDGGASAASSGAGSGAGTGIGGGGALLLSVVGAKMSEGINFSDDLARCVMVVGLPYPDRRDPELRQRMAFLDRAVGAGAGNEYYQTICMRAVNQSIGRSIRHRGDYASILLVDARYGADAVVKQLPGWIAARALRMQTIGPAIAQLQRFFAARRGG